MKNYVNLKEFSCEVKPGEGLLGAIARGYIKYYIDEGMLTSDNALDSIYSIIDSSIYSLLTFLKSVKGESDEVKINIENVVVDTKMPIDMEVLDLRVQGMLDKDVFIPLTPELENIPSDDVMINTPTIPDNIFDIYEVANTFMSIDINEDISKAKVIVDTYYDFFGINVFDNEVFTIGIKPFKKYVESIVVEELASFGTPVVGYVEYSEEEESADEVIVRPVPLEAKPDTVVGNYHIVKQISHPSKTIAGDAKGEYTVADGGVFGKIIYIAAFNYINMEKEQKDRFKKPTLSDALKVTALATTVFWDFIDDITREGYPLLEGCKFSIRTTLTPTEYNPVFIDIEYAETNEYKFDEEVIYYNETELFERVADCISCTCNQFDYEGDEVYDEYMLKTLGAYIGSDFNLPIIDYLEEVRQKIEAVQDEFQSVLGI